MPAPRPWIGRNQLHLIGKLLDSFTPEEMEQAGFTKHEIADAEQLFEDVDNYLTDVIGDYWDETEVL